MDYSFTGSILNFLYKPKQKNPKCQEYYENKD